LRPSPFPGLLTPQKQQGGFFEQAIKEIPPPPVTPFPQMVDLTDSHDSLQKNNSLADMLESLKPIKLGYHHPVNIYYELHKEEFKKNNPFKTPK
jgi:hypothetical protein